MQFYKQVRYGQSVPSVFPRSVALSLHSNPYYVVSTPDALNGLGDVAYSPVLLNGLGAAEPSYEEKRQFLSEIEELEKNGPNLDAQVVFRQATEIQDRLGNSGPWEFTRTFWPGYPSIPAKSDLNLRVGAIRTMAAGRMNQNQVASEKAFQQNPGTSKFIDDSKTKPALVQNAVIVSEELKAKGDPIVDFVKRESGIYADAAERTKDDIVKGPLHLLDKMGPWKWVVYGGVALVAIKAIAPLVSGKNR